MKVKQDQVCGSNIVDSLKKSNQSTSLSKMSLTYAVMDLPESFKISGRSGMTQSGILYPLEALVPHISVKESGLLPTPTAAQYGTSNNGQRSDGTTHKQKGKMSLQTLAVRGLLPTPMARDWKDTMSPAAAAEGLLQRRKSPTLGLLASAGYLSLPTPTTFDSGNPLPPRKKNPSGGQKPPLVSVIGEKLDPRFVEWMMGAPIDWTKVSEEGVPDTENQRKVRIKQLGNALVPQIVEILGKAIVDYEDNSIL